MNRLRRSGVFRIGGVLLALAGLVVVAGALASWGVFAHEAKANKAPPAAKQEMAKVPPAWGKVCVKDKTAKSPGEGRCQVVQRELAMPQKQMLAMLAIRYTGKDGKAQMTLTVPLGIEVGAGVGFRIDNGKWVKLPVITCLPTGCLAGIGLNAKDISALEGAAKGWVAYTADSGKTLSVPVELKGLKEALAGLKG